MTDEYVTESTITRSDGHEQAQLTLPKDVDELLGTPEQIVWFYDRKSGFVYALPPSEVGVRE